MRRVALAAALCALAEVARAAAPVTLLVGFAPGQGADVVAGPDSLTDAGRRLTSEATYDDSGRFYAERLGAFLPGAPAVTMKLLPGAGSLLAAATLRAARGDGSVLAMLGPRAVLEPLVRPRNASWRAADFKWIGARQRDDDVCVARADSGVATTADLRAKELFVAALAPGSRSYIYASALNELGGARLKIISGYGGEFESARALETGEVLAWCGWSQNALLYRHEELLRGGRVRTLVRFSVDAVDGRDVPRAEDIPRAEDLAASGDDRATMRAVASQTRFGAFTLAAPPSTPPIVVERLRAAYLAMLRDPETLRLAAARGLDVDPVPGDELQTLAGELDALPAGAAARLGVALGERQ